ncbi:MAG: D-glucuronyl C5-epimerase family protein [Candidatus Thorarchaeota archaeon]
MRVRSSIKAGISLLGKHRSTLKRRFLIYMIVMLMFFPFVFVNRTEIYRTFLSNFDEEQYSYTEEGLVVTDYGYQTGVYIGPHITIRAVSNKAIHYYDEMLEGNSTAGQFFNNSIDFILEKINVFNVPTENGTKTICNWPYEFSIYGLPVGWTSGMVDAKAIHTLALAYEAYGNSTYLEIVEQVAGTFETPVSLGGNLYILEDGTSWYPELIVTSDLDPNYKPPFVFNGFLIALYHIYQANLIFNNSRLERVFNLGVISAAQNIHLYDSAYEWSIYHLGYPLKLASRNYHRIHINMCNFLYDYTNVTIFKHYADKWAGFDNPPPFTWEEIVSPEFIGYGLLMAGIIFFPLLSIDIIQTLVRRRMKHSSKSNDNSP